MEIIVHTGKGIEITKSVHISGVNIVSYTPEGAEQCFLGAYKTEDRALEVLNLIEKHIVALYKEEQYNIRHDNYDAEAPNPIFYMPKE